MRRPQRDDSDLVWSSDQGDLRGERSGSGRQGAKGKRRDGSRPASAAKAAPRTKPAAGTRAKVRRETSGRRGKAVTTVTDLPLPDAEVKALGKELKKLCGVGGTVRDGTIELQGDRREQVLARLAERGIDAVAAGG